MNIPVFVIGLPDSFRGQRLLVDLRESSVPPEVIDGVLVRSAELSDLADQLAAKRLLHRPLVAGEVGCALAHRRVYEKMVAGGTPFALVLEDDVEFVNDFLLDGLDEWLYVPQPRVLSLAYDNSTVARQSLVVKDKEESAFERVLVPPTLAAAYLLNIAAAEVLIDSNSRITFPADWPVRSAGVVEWYVSRTPVFGQRLSAQSAIAYSGARVVRFSPRRVVDYVMVITHARWVFHRRDYRNYSSYVAHEFLRPFLFRCLARTSRWSVVASPLNVGPLRRRIIWVMRALQYLGKS